jgi:hypothetical protein
MQANRSLTPFLFVALFALSLAACTGVLLRFGMIYGMPSWAQNYAAVRHAHSHLMYFGWVTLALMVLIWRAVQVYTGRPLPRAVTWQLAATSLVALLSYPAFWQNGYGLTEIGAARLPLGSMVSTFNGLTWFWFIFLYVRATRGLAPRPLPVQLWDWAIMLLLVASLGAAGLVGMVFGHVDNPFLQQLFLHQFLDLFAVGWFNLAVLGIFWSHLEQAQRPQAASAVFLPRWLPTMSLALLLTPTFLLGVSPAVLPQHLFWLAAGANIAAAALLTIHGYRYLRTAQALASPHFKRLPGLHLLAFGALGVTIVVAFVLLVPGIWADSASGPLRVFYLHDLLLGWVSSALLIMIDAQYVLVPWLGLRRAIYVLWEIGVVVMLAALLGLGMTSVLPLSALTLLQLAAWASVLVATAAVLLLGSALLARMRPQGAEALPAPAHP